VRSLRNFTARGETLPVFVFSVEEAPAVLGVRTAGQAEHTLRLMRDAGDLVHDEGRFTFKVRLPRETERRRYVVVRDRSDRLGVERLGHARRFDARQRRSVKTL